MSTAPRPQRPRQNQPPRTHQPSRATFMRRRILVLIILIGLGALLFFGGKALIGMVFSPSEPEVVEEDSGPTEEELANPVDCVPGAVDLSVNLASDSLPAGQPANLPIQVNNTGEVPCLLEVSKETISVVITSGDDEVWNSKHCGEGLPDSRQIVLDTGASDTTVISWPGTRSESGCEADQPKTKAGTYRLNVEIDAGETELTEEQVFGLH